MPHPKPKSIQASPQLIPLLFAAAAASNAGQQQNDTRKTNRAGKPGNQFMGHCPLEQQIETRNNRGKLTPFGEAVPAMM